MGLELVVSLPGVSLDERLTAGAVMLLVVGRCGLLIVAARMKEV